MQMNLQMLQCMNNGSNNNVVTSVTSQIYPQVGNGGSAHMPSTNSMASHIPNNVSNLHQNTHRSLEVPSTMQNNNIGTLSSCNSSNVNMSDFGLELLEQSFNTNEYYNFMNEMI